LKSYFEGKLSIGTNDVDYAMCLAWLEKQGECHINHDDEIMIKQLTEYFTTGHGLQNTNGTVVEWLNDVKERLEKQGEQKPTNKVESKFKVGNFIVNDYCFGKVVALTDDAYLLDNGQGIPFSCEHNAHLWTIQDAKKGDVLVNDTILIIVDHLGTFENRPIIYSWYFADSEKFHGIGPTEPDRWEVKGFIPATKEQREQLERAMADAGYRWNKEELKLEKI
jgi:hypothetical protein